MDLAALLATYSSLEVRLAGRLEANNIPRVISSSEAASKSYLPRKWSRRAEKRHRTAIYMILDWGWTWKNIDVMGSKIAIDASAVSDAPDSDTGRYQGTGVRALKWIYFAS
jgi:hypothetical protein